MWGGNHICERSYSHGSWTIHEAGRRAGLQQILGGGRELPLAVPAGPAADHRAAHQRPGELRPLRPGGTALLDAQLLSGKEYPLARCRGGAPCARKERLRLVGRGLVHGAGDRRHDHKARHPGDLRLCRMEKRGGVAGPGLRGLCLGRQEAPDPLRPGPPPYLRVYRGRV